MSEDTGRIQIRTTLVITTEYPTDEMTLETVKGLSGWVADFVRDMSNFEDVKLADTAVTTLRYAYHPAPRGR